MGCYRVVPADLNAIFEDPSLLKQAHFLGRTISIQGIPKEHLEAAIQLLFNQRITPGIEFYSCNLSHIVFTFPGSNYVFKALHPQLPFQTEDEAKDAFNEFMDGYANTVFGSDVAKNHNLYRLKFPNILPLDIDKGTTDKSAVNGLWMSIKEGETLKQLSPQEDSFSMPEENPCSLIKFSRVTIKPFCRQCDRDRITLIVQQKMNLVPRSSLSTHFMMNGEKLKTAVMHVALFICRTGWSDVALRNMPAMASSKSEKGKETRSSEEEEEICIVDAEERESASFGIFGAAINANEELRKGLYHAVPEKLRSIVTVVAQQYGITEGGSPKGHQSLKQRMSCYESVENINEWSCSEKKELEAAEES